MVTMPKVQIATDLITFLEILSLNKILEINGITTTPKQLKKDALAEVVYWIPMVAKIYTQKSKIDKIKPLLMIGLSNNFSFLWMV